MAARIDWTGLRLTSQNIPDFVNQLLKAVNKYPLGQRGKVLRETLIDISPEVEPRVRRETEILVKRGYGPEKALKLAIVVTLRNRRKRLFHYLFFTRFPEIVNDFLKRLHVLTSQEERLQAVAQFIQAYHRPKLQDYTREQALIRLEETGFPSDVVKEALAENWRSADQIMADIQLRLSRGELETEVYQDELRSMLFEFGLRFLMSQGVAKGPDFCALAAILAIATTVISVGVTVGTSVASSVAEEKALAQLDMAERAERQRLQSTSIATGTLENRTDLSEEELRRVAVASVQAGESYQEALSTLGDVLRNERNRERPTPTELARFRALWGDFSTEARAGAIAQSALDQRMTEYQAAAADVQRTKTINLAVAGLAGFAVLGGLVYVAKKQK